MLKTLEKEAARELVRQKMRGRPGTASRRTHRQCGGYPSPDDACSWRIPEIMRLLASETVPDSGTAIDMKRS
jgi:hypothetical protein